MMKKLLLVILAFSFLGMEANAISERKRKGLSKNLVKMAQKGKLKNVKKLIGQGADLSYLGQCAQPHVKYSCSALYSAILAGHMEVAKELLKKGKSLNLLNAKNKETALMAAVKKNNEKLVDLLVDAGADVNIENKKGVTPLILASWEGNLNILKKLVSGGADVNHADNKGQTSLMDAAEKGHSDIVSGYWALGVDVDAKNAKGETAFELALREGHQEIYLFLEERMSNQKDIDSAIASVERYVVRNEARRTEEIRRLREIYARNNRLSEEGDAIAERTRERNRGIVGGDPLGSFMSGLAGGISSWVRTGRSDR